MALIDNPVKPNTQAKTEVARQAFLYGNGDGKPVLETHALVAISGVHEATINRHMPTWIKEREQMLLEQGNCAFGVSVAPETIAQHKRDMQFLRDQADTLEREIKLCEKLEAKILRWIDDIEARDGDIPATEVRMFMAACTSRKSLQSQFLEITRRLNQYNGIDGMNEIAMTRQKTLASGRARLEVAADKAKLDAPPMPSAQAGSRDARFSGSTPAVEAEKPVEQMTDAERYGEL